MSRQLSVTSLILRFLFIFLAFSQTTRAAENTQSFTKLIKEGKTYFSGGVVLNEFRSIALPIAKSEELDFTFDRKFPLTAQTYALAFTYGTYIAENFRTELRYGTGIVDDTVDELLDININYYFNWYIGGTIPVTDDWSAYALIGVSFYDADITRREVWRSVFAGEQFPENAKIQPSSALNDDLFGTNFSMSWMLGLDYKLDDSWFLAFEYGRLLKDTESNIKVYQAGMQLRYEY